MRTEQRHPAQRLLCLRASSYSAPTLSSTVPVGFTSTLSEDTQLCTPQSLLLGSTCRTEQAGLQASPLPRKAREKEKFCGPPISCWYSTATA